MSCAALPLVNHARLVLRVWCEAHMQLQAIQSFVNDMADVQKLRLESLLLFLTGARPACVGLSKAHLDGLVEKPRFPIHPSTGHAI
jgi:hypothetical protein